MKRAGLIAVAVVLALALTSCGLLGKIKGSDNDTEKNKGNSEVEDVVDNGDRDNIDKDTEDNSSEDAEDTEDSTGIDMPKELEETVNKIIEATANEGSLENLTVNLQGDEVNNEVYYTSEQLFKAMNKDEAFSILTKSDSVEVVNAEKISKAEWVVEFKNEMGDTSRLQMVKVDDSWLLNISNMVTVARIQAPTGVQILLNGKEVPFDLSTKADRGSNYEVYGVLRGAENILIYETGLSENFSKLIISESEKPQNCLYELTDADLADMLPKVEQLWTSVKKAAVANDAVTVQKFVADSAKITADAILNGLKNNENNTTIQSFEKRTDKETEGAENICYMTDKNTYRLNLLGRYAQDIKYGGNKTPTEFNLVTVENTDEGLKIVDASNDGWMSDVYSYSID